MLIYWINTNNMQTIKTYVKIIDIKVKHALKLYDKIQFL